MSLFRKLLGDKQDGGPGKGGNTTPPGLQTMGAQLQRKFAKGVQYNSMFTVKILNIRTPKNLL